MLLIFDLDGTLVDSKVGILNSLSTVRIVKLLMLVHWEYLETH